MTNTSQKTDLISTDLNELANEMRVVLQHTKALWDTEDDFGHRHFPNTLYGFMMCLMAKVDYLSQHWIRRQSKQTKRMVEFLHQYLGYPKKASEIAVQFFRHNLMHASTLSEIYDREGNKYYWHLHQQVGPELRGQHMTLEPGKLNAGAFYFLDDLIGTIPKLRKAAESDLAIIDSWEAVERRVREFTKQYQSDGSEAVPLSAYPNRLAIMDDSHS